MSEIEVKVFPGQHITVSGLGIDFKINPNLLIDSGMTCHGRDLFRDMICEKLDKILENLVVDYNLAKSKNEGYGSDDSDTTIIASDWELTTIDSYYLYLVLDLTEFNKLITKYELKRKEI